MRLSPTQRHILLAALAGLVACLLGLAVDPKTFFATYLAVWFAVCSIPLGALAVLLTSYIVRAGWTRDLHAPLTGVVLTLPAIALLFIPVLAGLSVIYPWASGTIALPSFKAVYLTSWFFVIRAVAYIAIWMALALWAARAYGDDRAMVRAASAGLIIWALSVSWAGIDWLESIEPLFHSSIYGLLSVSFCLLTGIAVALIAALGVKRSQTMQNAAYAGVFISVLLLWAYLHAMQYIIIWTGDLPDEVVWYIRRLEGGWAFALWGLFILQFVVPFFVLLSERARQSTGVLLWIAGLTLALRYLEAIVLALPPLHLNGWMLALDIPAAVLMIGSVWLFALTFAARYTGRLTLSRAAPAH